MIARTNSSTIALKTRSVQSIAAAIQKQLARTKGATLAEIMDLTGWLPHSSRAFLTRLRNKGTTLVRECRTTGETCWRIEH